MVFCIYNYFSCCSFIYCIYLCILNLVILYLLFIREPKVLGFSITTQGFHALHSSHQSSQSITSRSFRGFEFSIIYLLKQLKQNSAILESAPSLVLSATETKLPNIYYIETILLCQGVVEILFRFCFQTEIIYYN